jgi:hypothetical protein
MPGKYQYYLVRTVFVNFLRQIEGGKIVSFVLIGPFIRNEGCQ